MKFKELLRSEHVHYLGKKRVTIDKLTPKKWRQLFSTIENLPSLIIQVATAPKDDFHAYLLSAADLALDEIIEVISVLSGVDKEYIEENVGLDEIVTFLVKTAKRNKIEEVVKNVTSLLTKETK